VLRSAIDVAGQFDSWKESCVPSYCHRNFAAAYVSWLRLFKVVEMAQAAVPRYRRVIDFGSSVGELGHLIDPRAEYHFIEQDEAAAAFLMSQHPRAIRQELTTAPLGEFDAVFAIDSLEHNDNYADLLQCLFALTAPGGVVILSGPTENALYRLGRKLAGFSGGYHVTTIHQIEAAASRHSKCLMRATVPFGAPLFMVSAWMPSVVAAGTGQTVSAQRKLPLRSVAAVGARSA
jgi:hypothetical protein